ncbi:MAG: hypothetical protein V4560_05915 [Bacteroidota bacterium]
MKFNEPLLVILHKLLPAVRSTTPEKLTVAVVEDILSDELKANVVVPLIVAVPVPAIVKTALLLFMVSPFDTVSVFDKVRVVVPLIVKVEQVEVASTVGCLKGKMGIITLSPATGAKPPSQFAPLLQLTSTVPNQVRVAALATLPNANTNNTMKKSKGLFNLLGGILFNTDVFVLYAIVKYFRFFKQKNNVNI